VRDTPFGRWEESVSPALKVRRHCPLVLVVDVMRMIGIRPNIYITLEGLRYSKL
jgi:hypothetical protein